MKHCNFFAHRSAHRQQKQKFLLVKANSLCGTREEHFIAAIRPQKPRAHVQSPPPSLHTLARLTHSTFLRQLLPLRFPPIIFFLFQTGKPLNKVPRSNRARAFDTRASERASEGSGLSKGPIRAVTLNTEETEFRRR